MTGYIYVGKNAWRKLNRLHIELKSRKISINKAKLFDMIMADVTNEKIIKKIHKTRLKDINSNFWNFDM